jgi:hypothetical protein
MLKTTIKLKKETAERAARIAGKAGYSSLQEFVEHVLEKELKRFEGADSDDEITKKLKGLGYLD